MAAKSAPVYRAGSTRIFVYTMTNLPTRLIQYRPLTRWHKERDPNPDTKKNNNVRSNITEYLLKSDNHVCCRLMLEAGKTRNPVIQPILGSPGVIIEQLIPLATSSTTWKIIQQINLEPLLRQGERLLDAWRTVSQHCSNMVTCAGTNSSSRISTSKSWIRTRTLIESWSF